MNRDINNECIINGVQYKCRTCFDPGQKIFALTDEAGNKKTWLDLLKDIAQLQTNDEPLPKTLCCKCLDKLKGCYDFVLQIHDVNKKYYQLLTNDDEILNEDQNFTDCLAESVIDLPFEQYMSEIKLEEKNVLSYNIDTSGNTSSHEPNRDRFKNEDTHDPFTQTNDEDFNPTAEQLEDNESSSSTNGNDMGSKCRQPLNRERNAHFSYDDLIEDANNKVLCFICKKEFNFRKNCRRHIANIHFKKNKLPAKSHEDKFNCSAKEFLFENRIYNKPTAWRLVECKLCSTNFKTCKELRQHLENHIDIDTLHSLELTDNVVEYLFPNMTNLKLIKESICEDIRKKQWFRYYAVLNEYSYEMSISDTEEEDLEEVTKLTNKYKCAFCSDVFSYKYQAFPHLKETHSKEQIPLKCNQCKLEFVSIKMYKQHLQTHCHNKHKVLLCEQCPGKFFWPENVKRHKCATKILTKTSSIAREDQLNCTINVQEFQIQTKNQEQLVTPETEVPIMRCGLCVLSFRKLRHLREHITLHADGKTGIDFKNCIYVKQFESSKATAIDYEILQQQIQNGFNNSQISRFYQALNKYGNEIDISDSDSDSCTELANNKDLGTGYKCGVCKEIFKKRKHILKHQLETHNDEQQMPFFCKNCKQQYVNNHLLQLHLKRECWNKNQHINQQCEICNARFIWPYNLLKHKEIQHNMTTELSHCISSNNPLAPSQPVAKSTACKQQTPKTEKQFVCSFCVVSFSNHTNLMRHIETRHTDEKHFKCGDCEMSFVRAADLQSHRLTHGGEDPFKCTFCGKSFSRQNHLNSHKRVHKSENVHQCTTCQKSFKKWVNLKQHLLTHYKCDICSKTFTCVAYLRRHRQLMGHTDLWYTLESTSDSKVLENTTTNEIKKLLCPICGVYLSKNTGLTQHMRTHTGDKPFKCDFCEMAFIRRFELRDHRRTHTKERPFKCPHCEKAFVQHQKLKNHIRVHTGERPYKCKYCEKSFNTSDYLILHLRGHTGEKPYKCDICDKAFICAAYLKKHRISKGHLVEENVAKG